MLKYGPWRWGAAAVHGSQRRSRSSILTLTRKSQFCNDATHSQHRPGPSTPIVIQPAKPTIRYRVSQMQNTGSGYWLSFGVILRESCWHGFLLSCQVLSLTGALTRCLHIKLEYCLHRMFVNQCSGDILWTIVQASLVDKLIIKAPQVKFLTSDC